MELHSGACAFDKSKSRNFEKIKIGIFQIFFRLKNEIFQGQIFVQFFSNNIYKIPRKCSKMASSVTILVSNCVVSVASQVTLRVFRTPTSPPPFSILITECGDENFTVRLHLRWRHFQSEAPPGGTSIQTGLIFQKMKNYVVLKNQKTILHLKIFLFEWNCIQERVHSIRVKVETLKKLKYEYFRYFFLAKTNIFSSM